MKLIRASADLIPVTRLASTRCRLTPSLVRQAQLGASYRVPCQSSRAGSPHRAKSNQQPVPSVAPVAEPDRLVNKTGEAYTGNTAGRRGGVPALSNLAPLGAKMQLATVLMCRKPAHRDRIGEILRDCRGPWSVACSERSIRNLGDPSSSFVHGGRTYQPQEERLTG